MRRDPVSVGTPSTWIFDGKHFTAPLFRENGLQLGFPGAFRTFVALETSEFHTYRFEDKGDRLDAYVDGTRVDAYNVPKLSDASFVFMFGDTNMGPRGISVAEWDYVSVTTDIELAPIPLPPTFWLMGATLAGLAAAARPRKGRAAL